MEKETWIDKIEKDFDVNVDSSYTYTDEDGKYLYTKIYLEDEKTLFGVLQGNEFHYGINGIEKTLYNLPTVARAVNSDKEVYITQGEENVETLKGLGLPACTAGGADDWKKDFAEPFAGATVIVLPNNDVPGLRLKNVIINDLENYAHSVRWAITSDSVTDYIKKEGHTKSDLEKLVSEAREIFAPWLYTDGKGKLKINPDIMAYILQKSMKYIRVRNRDDDKEDIYYYKNGVYTLCGKNEFKGYIRKYIPVGLASDVILNNVYNLMMCNGEKTYSHDDLNADSNIINFKNGIYNIRKRELTKHNSGILSSIQLDCNYNETAPSPTTFLKFMNDLCTDEEGNVDSEKMAVLQEWVGILLSNVPVRLTKKSLLLYSPLGNTGKSQLLGLLGKLLGYDNIINIPIQKLSERFSMGNVYGKRLIMVGDQGNSDIEDSSLFKQVTGGDMIEAEKKGKQSFTFVFNGGLVMACNGLPYFKDDKGEHVFERLYIVPLTNVIPKEKQDRELLSKMLEEKEGIILWALEGLHRLLDNNYTFTQSEAHDKILTEYRSESDTLFSFINANYIVTENRADRVRRSEFYNQYYNWCLEMELTPLSKKSIKSRAFKNGLGLIIYHGYEYFTSIKKRIDGFTVITGAEENIPFDN